MRAGPSAARGSGSISSKRSMRNAISRATKTAAYTNEKATIAIIAACIAVPFAETISAANVQPISPDAKAMAIESTPVSRSELCSTVVRYNQNRIAGPANGPSVRKLLHAKATDP